MWIPLHVHQNLKRGGFIIDKQSAEPDSDFDTVGYFEVTEIQV
jgi:hypothetical protein